MFSDTAQSSITYVIVYLSTFGQAGIRLVAMGFVRISQLGMGSSKSFASDEEDDFTLTEVFQSFRYL